MRPPASSPGRASALVIAAIALAACAAPTGSAPGAVPTGGPASSGAAVTLPPGAATPSVAPRSSVAGFTGDACDLLSDDDILQIAGVPVAEKGPSPLAYQQTCLWRLDTVAWEITLGVDPNGGVTGYDRLVEYQGGGEEIPFLGDRAIRLEDSNNPIAQLGSALYDLQFVGVGELPDLDVRLLERVLRNAAGGS